MADRRDYFFRQKVTEDELDQGFETLEQAEWNFAVDLAKFGVLSGLVVTQHAGVPDLTTDITAGGSYDQSGRRVRVPALQQQTVATDSNNTSTAVVTVGNEKWVSIFLQFDRLLDDPRTDGNSQSVYFVRDESFKVIITQGAEASVGTATRPALMNDAILLADVLRTHGQTQILNADISTTRRQDAIVIAGSPLAIRRGLIETALADVVAAYNGLINGSGNTLAAAFVTYAGGPNWRDGATNPATNAEAQLDKIITDIASITGGASGMHHAGCDAIAGGSGTIAAGTAYSVLSALKLSSNHEYAGSGLWADGTSLPASSQEAATDGIVSALASFGASGGGAKIGINARTNWLGGRTNPIATLFVALDKIITDLAEQTSGDDGMERIGGQAVAGSPDSLSAGSSRSQANELLTLVNARAKLSGATFSGGVIHNALATFNAGLVVDTDQTMAINNATISGTPTFSGNVTLDGGATVPSGDTLTVAGAVSVTNTANTVTLASRDVDRSESGVGYADPTHWLIGSDGLWRSQATTLCEYHESLGAPHGAVLKTYSVTYKGSAGHGALPANPPSVQIIKTNLATGSQTTVGSQTDPSASVGAFEAIHLITISGMSETVNRTTHRYAVVIKSEFGANAQANAVYFGASRNTGVTRLDETP
jgi:hypothetical protein